MMDIINGKIIIKTEDDLLEIINKTLVFVIRNKPKKLQAKREKDLIVLYENSKYISESHYEWYLNDKTLVFTNIIACENFLKEEARCEAIAEALYAFRKKNGRTWKSKLRDSFENGTNRNSYLQRFRNQFEFSVLNKIKKNSTVKQIIELLMNYK